MAVDHLPWTEMTVTLKARHVCGLEDIYSWSLQSCDSCPPSNNIYILQTLTQPHLIFSPPTNSSLTSNANLTERALGKWCWPATFTDEIKIMCLLILRSFGGPREYRSLKGVWVLSNTRTHSLGF